MAIAPTARAAPVWQEPVALAWGRVYEPQVAGSARGLAVAWSQVLGEGCQAYGATGCQRIRAAVRRSDGSFSDPATLSVDGVHSGEPRVAVTPDGDVLVAWMRAPGEGGGGSTLEVSSGSVASGEFSAPVRISTEGRTGGSYRLVTNSEGAAALMWTEAADEGGSRSLLGSFRPPDGGFGPATTLVEPAPLAAATVALADDGRLLVAWAEEVEQDRALFARVRSPDGTLSELEMLQYVKPVLNAAAIGPVEAAWTSSGQRVVAWLSSPSSCMYCFGTTVYATSAGTGRFSAPQALAPSNEAHRDLQLATDERGRTVAAWERSSADRFDEDDVPREIQVAERLDSATGFGEALSVPGSVPRLAMTGSSAYVLAQTWSGDYERPQTRLFGTFRPEDPGARITRRVAPAVPWITWSAVGGTPRAALLAAWVEGSAPPTQLRVAFAADDPAPPGLTGVRPRRRTLTRGRDALELRFVVSERVDVELRLRRAGTAAPQVARTAAVGPGARKIRIGVGSLRKLRPGRYRATMRATDAAGQASRTRTVGIRLKRR